MSGSLETDDQPYLDEIQRLQELLTTNYSILAEREISGCYVWIKQRPGSPRFLHENTAPHGKKKHRWSIKKIRSDGGTSYFAKAVYMSPTVVPLDAREEFLRNCDGTQLTLAPGCLYPPRAWVKPWIPEYAMQTLLWAKSKKHFPKPHDFILREDGHGWMVMELCGEALIDSFCEGATPESTESFAVCKQVTSAVRIMHENLCAHLDIKLDNVVNRNERHGYKYVLIDFGHAVRLDHRTPCSIPLAAYMPGDSLHGTDLNHFLHTSLWYQSRNVGTAQNKAPETCVGSIINPFAADIWSLGIMFYTLYMGRYVGGKDTYDDQGNYVADTVDISDVENIDDPRASALALLLHNMLKIDYRERPTIFEVLSHPFFTA